MGGVVADLSDWSRSTPAVPAIVTQELSRNFGRVAALRNVSLEVPSGTLLGLLGPNGSGKTTLLSILAGFIAPTSGSFQLLGQEDHRQALSRTGSLISRPLLWPHLSCRDNLLCLQGMYGQDEAGDQADSLLARVGLDGGGASRKFGQCSTGMRQRLGIATALIGDPDLLLLDEPTTGLDPEGMVEIRELIRSLAQESGRTIIMSSHMLNEVELICDSYAIIYRGEVVDQGAVTARSSGSAYIQISTTDDSQALDYLQRKGWIAEFRNGQSGRPQTLLVNTSEGNGWEVARDLSEIRIFPVEMRPLSRDIAVGSLEEKYLAAVGRTETNGNGRM